MAYQREYYIKNKEAIYKRKVAHRKNNPLMYKEIAKRSRVKRRDKLNAYQRMYYQKNKESVNKSRQSWALKSLYKISREEFDQMFKSQNESCAICGKKHPFGGRGDKIQVDHDHFTGKIRGLLCSDCNLGLGKFKDSIANLYRAIEYLNNQTKE